MVLDTLQKAGGMIRRFPLLGLVGLIAGILGGTTFVIQFYGGMFFTERVGILHLIVLPFFIGGAFQIIQKQDGSPSVFWEGGKKYYLRILLATVVILFVSLVTLLALIVPLTVIGIAAETGMISLILLVVLIPLAYFTLFYDVAIVFEDRKVLDSLRRSVEVVVSRGFPVFKFIIVNLLIFAGIVLVLLIIWGAALSSQLEPLALNTTIDQPISLEAITGALGPTGIQITALLYLIGVTISVTIFYAYKACFFQKYAEKETTTPIVGEYDEKGRWYKY